MIDMEAAGGPDEEGGPQEGPDNLPSEPVVFPDDRGSVIQRADKLWHSRIFKLGGWAAIGLLAVIPPHIGLPLAVFTAAWKLEDHIGWSAGIRKRAEKRKLDKLREQQAAKDRERQKLIDKYHPEKAKEKEAPADTAAETKPSSPGTPGDPAAAPGSPEAEHAAAMEALLRRVAGGEAATVPGDLRREIRAAILHNYDPKSSSPRVRDFGAALLMIGAATDPASARAIAEGALTGYRLRPTSAPAAAGPAHTL